MKYIHNLTALLLIFLFLAACSVPATVEQAQPTATSIFTGAPSPVEDYSHLGLTDAEAATLLSLEQIDGYPLYTMHYYAAYETVSRAPDLPLANLPPANASWACSLFTSLADPANMLYGRNFDWDYSPALLLFTNPLDGYDSVSMVDIAYLGFGGDRAIDLAEAPLDELVALLGTPYLPFDGMNEQGLAVGMAAVPPGDMQLDPNKHTIGSILIIRKMLDHAATVDEAIAIIQSFNIDSEGGPPVHYLIADASGRAALVEFYQGEMRIIYNAGPWHQATNFLVSSTDGSPEGQCPRYDTLSQRLTEMAGSLTISDAISLLGDVSQEGTQWSIVYGMSTGDIHVAMGQQYDSVHILHLDTVDE